MPNPGFLLSLTAVIFLLLAGLFWPEKGLLSQWQAARNLTKRVQIEDALKHIHDCEYHGRHPAIQSVAGALHITVNDATDLLTEMQSLALVLFEQNKLRLTSQGRQYALQIIRAHRLWERYLADKTGYPQAEWHGQSEVREHHLTPDQTTALSKELGFPVFDPHGDPIPTESGELLAPKGSPLSAFPLDQPGRIVHLEDEPEAVYAQLIAEGLAPGMTMLITEISPQRICFWADGQEHILAPIIAANISVMPVEAEKPIESAVTPLVLSDLKPGETARVTGISRASRGAERRRLMDLGILSGTIIKAEMVSPSGDPTAYLIRGALIGLRKEQATFIKISRDLQPNSAQLPG